MSNKQPNRDDLGSRMKGYEFVTRNHLSRRSPVIIRIDGRAFHTFTKHIIKLDESVDTQNPFSDIMHDLMVKTTNALVHEIQGCVLGYTQSDEISLLLKDWATYETQAWFDSNISKILSVSASIATMSFNQSILQYNNTQLPTDTSLHATATFDSRVFNIPPSEVCNYFIWRQQDATRNSVQMLGHHHYSQKQMNGLSNSQVQDKLMSDHQINWNDLEVWKKRGTCVLPLAVDEDIPIFKQDRLYVEQYL